MKPRAMVVDDSALIRQQVKRALGSAGFDVLEAEDGLVALERLEQSEPVTLVVCDVNMPRMGGLELLERLHAAPKYADIAVLMLTSEAHADLMKRAKELGSKGWLVKPFKADLLVAAAKHLARSDG